MVIISLEGKGRVRRENIFDLYGERSIKNMKRIVFVLIIDQLMASYQHKYFTIMYQRYTGQAEDRSSDQNDRDGYNIAAHAKMPFHTKLKIFARYDVYDDNDTLANYDEETTIYGASYDLTKGVMAWGAVEDKDYKSGLEGSHTDYEMTQVGLAIKF